MSDEREHRLDRLSDAIDAWMDHDRGSTSRDDLLEEHPDLRELLEPMVADDGEDAGDAGIGRIRGFDLVREIGRGGMGIVYEARQHSLGRRVAVKVLAAHLTHSPRRIERFRREASAAAKLQHPGIVPIYEVGESGGMHFFAMDFVDGKNLGDLIAASPDPTKRVGAMSAGTPPAEAAEIAAQVAEALAHAHERGVIHRDIKPHNILIAGGRARLVDFGLAKDLDKDSLSRTGELSGTPNYMSPEQALAGSGTIDHRTDVYSLGVVLYELLTRKRPFEAESTQRILYDISFHDPVAVRKQNSEIPRDLETICHKALEKNPDHRYQSATAMAEDLRRFLEHLPIVAKPPGPVTRVVKFARRKPGASVAAVLAFLLVVIGPLAFMLYFKSSRDAIAAEKQKNEVRLHQLRTAVDRMIERATNLQEIGESPVYDEFSRKLMEDAVRIYESNLEQATDDDGLRVDAVETCLKIGHFHRLLGRVKEAEDVLTRARKTLAVLVSEDPEDVRYKKLEARLHDQFGGLYSLTSRYDEALAENDAAFADWQWIRDNGSAPQPERDWALGRMAATKGSIAELYLRRLSDHKKAVAAFEEAIALHDQLPEKQRELPPSMQSLAQAYNGLATLRFHGTANERVRSLLGKALALREKIVEKEPDSWNERHALVQSLTNIGVMYTRTQPAEAEKYLTKALAQAETLLSKNPASPQGRRMLAHVHYVLAKASDVVGKPDAAEEHFAHGLEQIETVVAEHPELLECHVLHVVMKLNQALFHQRRAIAIGDSDMEAAERRLRLAREAYLDCVPLLEVAVSHGAGKRLVATEVAPITDQILRFLGQGRDLPAIVEVSHRVSVLFRKVLRATAADADFRAQIQQQQKSHYRQYMRAVVKLADVELVRRCADSLIADVPATPSFGIDAAKLLVRAAKDGGDSALLDKAMAALRSAVEAGFGDATAIENERGLAALRDRPAFKQLVSGLRGEDR